MKRLFTLTLLLCTILTAMAAEWTITGKVLSQENAQPIKAATVSLLNPKDSTVLVIASTNETGTFSIKSQKAGEFLIHVACEAYEEAYQKLTLEKKQRAVDLGIILVNPNATELGGAVVKATAAKVVIKEDTFVYNSSAYKVPEGAYLENLIDQLPGVVVDDDGNITWNGKTVSQIRVDGKDFFKGDNSVAMKNLPADFVSKIKAYDKKSDYTEQTGIDDGNEETVLDLELKQKLKRAWSGNLDFALGNKDRYAGQAFAMGLTDNSRIAFYGNMNNTGNQGFRRGGRGNGLTANKDFGVDGNWNNGKKTLQAGFFEVGGRLSYGYSDTDRSSTTNSESFLSANKSTFSNSRSKNLGNSQRVNISGNLKWNPDSLTQMHFRPSFSFNKSHNFSQSASATFNSNPYEFAENPLDSMFVDTTDPENINKFLRNIAVNRNNRRSFSDSKGTNLNGEINITRRLNRNGRNISLRLAGALSDNDSKSFSLSDIHYYQTGKHTVNNQYSTSPSKNWNYSVRLSYSEPLIKKDLFLQTSYEYSHRYQDQNRNLYQLDSLDGFGHGGITPLYPMGYLPPHDSLMLARNIENSRYATYHYDNHSLQIGLRYVKENKETGASMNFSGGVNMQPQRTKLDYQKNKLDTIVVRNIFKVSPYVNLRYNFTRTNRIELRYNGSSSEPSMTNLLDITDTSDPLNITMGNPGLKPSWSNRFSLDHNNYFRTSQSSYSIRLNYNNTQNSISNKVTYYEETGKRETRPENINGNWDMGAGFNFNTSFSDSSPFSIVSRTNYNYSNNVGFVRVSSNADSQKNTARTSNIREWLRGSYKTGLFEFSLNGSVNYQHSRNKLQPQADLDTWGFSYYGNIQYTHEKTGLSISTNIGMESRRGYNDATMNTNELLWNAQLSKSFLKQKRAIISLQFYDILHERSNISRNISAYSRTDSRNNSINSYFLVHFIYKFNVFNGANGRMRSGNDREGGERGERGEGRPQGGPGGPGGGMRGGMGGPGGGMGGFGGPR